MTRFTRTVISGLTALSLALTPIPAAADGEDVAKALAGLAVLGIIAAAANDRDKRKEKRRQQQVRQYVPHNQFGSIEGGLPRRVIQGEIIRPGSRNQWQHRRVALPDRCLRIIATSRGNRAVYGKRCLRNNYAQVNQLPQRCQVQVRTDNRVRNAYAARCLRREGWQVAGY